jgi:hypothetical protein
MVNAARAASIKTKAHDVAPSRNHPAPRHAARGDLSSNMVTGDRRLRRLPGQSPDLGGAGSMDNNDA